ncbi:DUF488 domain-containing protein [Glycomyces sp. NPDC049804]|uniref:DUF488 domain-containing protein n=1 Tax=Glycomyces sp. NPDC049804 TaxID=3154363 RepID=UPI003438CD8A
MHHYARPLAEHVPAIFGVGYEGTSLADLIDRLHGLGVTHVADVRLNPVSRKPGMSKNKLRAALANADIEYLHLRSLGNPKENRPGFARPGPARQAALDTYSRILDRPDAQAALDELQTLAQTGRVALLCFESDPAACHHQAILARLAEG